jgi:hypothetical protein
MSASDRYREEALAGQRAKKLLDDEDISATPALKLPSLP